jgi:hypothetical protein
MPTPVDCRASCRKGSPIDSGQEPFGSSGLVVLSPSTYRGHKFSARSRSTYRSVLTTPRQTTRTTASAGLWEGAPRDWGTLLSAPLRPPRTFSARSVEIQRPSRAVPELPELGVELLGPLAQAWRVAIRNCPGDRHQQRPLEQGFAVARLDRRPASRTSPTLAPSHRVDPARLKASAEVAAHEHMFA